jgi:pyruvate,water dikinase
MIIYDKNQMNDVAMVGGKGLGLYKLILYGYEVPDFFVVCAGTQLDQQDFIAQLDEYAKKLQCDLFSVRSSNVNEDAAESSYAGQYLTELNVKRCDLYETVKKVAMSCEDQKVKAYSEFFCTSESKMAVIVQKQINGDKSGVLFTTSPFSANEILIESVNGAGEQLVSGNVTPIKQVFKKGQIPTEILEKNLITTAECLEKQEGKPLDIEWTSCHGHVFYLQMRPITALGDRLPPILEKRDWKLYVYRNFCLFCHGVQGKASLPQIQKKYFGFSVPIVEGLIVNGREFYSTQNDDAVKKFWQVLDKRDFFEVFLSAIKNNVTATKRRVDKLKNLDCLNFKTAELFAIYRREIEAYVKSYVPLMMRPDDYLYDKLVQMVGKAFADEIVSAESLIYKKTYYSSEKKDFLATVCNGKIAEYLDKYEWINNPLGKTFRPLTKEIFYKRAGSLTVQEADKKLQELTLIHKKNAITKKAVLQKIADKGVRRLADLIGEFIYMRTYTAENSDRYFYYIRKQILNPLADRLGISTDTLLMMSPQEVSDCEKGYSLSTQDIMKRRSGEVIVIKDGYSKVYYTERSYMLLNKLQPTSTPADAVLYGQAACMGEVTGRVKIVNGFLQAEDFNDGEIIVTTMTTPEITMALDKAVGIITDEGGVTCHAAIIAREYSIPCLVGTRNATTVLKDGMLVELDCVHGCVRILNDE